MHELILYKNRDEAQPLMFTGRTEQSCTNRLKKWMDANQGKRDTDPFGVDGLAIFPHQYNALEIAFIWDESYGEWRIEYGGDPDDFDTWCKDDFEAARDDFLVTVATYADWKW